MARNDETLDLGSWFILRVSAVKTLALYQSLKRAGFSVWTPIDEKVGRYPRSRSRYRKEVAMLPTYVFARSEDIGELSSIAALPTKDHPEFRVFQHDNAIPLLADASLDPLRDIEGHRRQIAKRNERRGKRAPVIAKGTKVLLSEGAWAGMPGMVIGAENSYTLVDFENFPQPIKISSLLLAESMQGAEAEPDDGDAAQAA